MVLFSYLLWDRFIKRQTSGTSSDNEWQPMTTSDNEWQIVTTNDNEWYNEWYNEWQQVVQWMTTSDTMSNNQWLLITTSGTINKNEWKRIRPSKKAWFWFQNETKWVMYNYNIYSAI